MAQIILTIPDEKLKRVTDAFVGLFPKPNEPTEDFIGMTDLDWMTDILKKYIINQTARFEQIKAQKDIVFAPDNSLLS